MGELFSCIVGMAIGAFVFALVAVSNKETAEAILQANKEIEENKENRLRNKGAVKEVISKRRIKVE